MQQRSALPGGQQWLMNALCARGFQMSVAALCFGISQMAMQALLAEDFATFEQRLQHIFNLHQHRDTLTVDKLIDIDAFFNGVLLYAQPAQYYFLFPNQAGPQLQEAKTAMALAISQKLQNNGGIHEQSFGTGAYTAEELKKYFSSLRHAFQTECQDNFPHALILRANHHAITISYDKMHNEWRLIDANKLPSKLFTDEDQLAQAVHHTLTRSNHAIFETTLYANMRDKTALEKMAACWKTSPSFQDIHQMTQNRIEAKDHNQHTLLSVSVMNRDIATAKQVLQAGVAPENHLPKNHMPLLYNAAYKGDIDMVALLIQHGAGVDTLFDADGTTPLMVAAMQGHKDVVALLLAHQANTKLISKQHGLTAAGFARHNRHIDTLRLLEKPPQQKKTEAPSMPRFFSRLIDKKNTTSPSLSSSHSPQ